MNSKISTCFLYETFPLPFNSLCPVAVAWDAKLDLGLEEHVHSSQGWKDNAFGMKVAHTLKKWKQPSRTEVRPANWREGIKIVKSSKVFLA